MALNLFTSFSGIQALSGLCASSGQTPINPITPDQVVSQTTRPPLNALTLVLGGGLPPFRNKSTARDRLCGVWNSVKAALSRVYVTKKDPALVREAIAGFVAFDDTQSILDFLKKLDTGNQLDVLIKEFKMMGLLSEAALLSVTRGTRHFFHGEIDAHKSDLDFARAEMNQAIPDRGSTLSSTIDYMVGKWYGTVDLTPIIIPPRPDIDTMDLKKMASILKAPRSEFLNKDYEVLLTCMGVKPVLLSCLPLKTCEELAQFGMEYLTLSETSDIVILYYPKTVEQTIEHYRWNTGISDLGDTTEDTLRDVFAGTATRFRGYLLGYDPAAKRDKLRTPFISSYGVGDWTTSFRAANLPNARALIDNYKQTLDWILGVLAPDKRTVASITPASVAEADIHIRYWIQLWLMDQGRRAPRRK